MFVVVQLDCFKPQCSVNTASKVKNQIRVFALLMLVGRDPAGGVSISDFGSHVK